MQRSEARYRRLMRLQGYDYSLDGAYFVTTCTDQRANILGEIVDGEMLLSDWGKAAQACWTDIPLHFPQVELDTFVVMPNHVHRIIVIANVEYGRGKACLAPTTSTPHRSGRQTPGSLSAMVGAYKSAVTKAINKMRGTPRAKVWQRGFYEHVIRDEDDLNTLRQYIIDNPARWELDHETATICSRERLHP